MSYLFKHVAGSVASPLHMMDFQWSGVGAAVKLRVLIVVVYLGIRQPAVCVSTHL